MSGPRRIRIGPKTDVETDTYQDRVTGDQAHRESHQRFIGDHEYVFYRYVYENGDVLVGASHAGPGPSHGGHVWWGRKKVTS